MGKGVSVPPRDTKKCSKSASGNPSRDKGKSGIAERRAEKKRKKVFRKEKKVAKKAERAARKASTPAAGNESRKTGNPNASVAARKDAKKSDTKKSETAEARKAAVRTKAATAAPPFRLRSKKLKKWKKNKVKKKGPRRFDADIQRLLPHPSSVGWMSAVPWNAGPSSFREDVDEENSEVDPMELFDAELSAFASYVRHGDDGNFARETALLELGGEVDSAFPASENVPRVRAFGSHSCPGVCCFFSDVDVAIFGIVPTEEERGRAEEFVECVERVERVERGDGRKRRRGTEQGGGTFGGAKRAALEAKKDREERILKWISVLDRAEATNEERKKEFETMVDENKPQKQTKLGRKMESSTDDEEKKSKRQRLLRIQMFKDIIEGKDIKEEKAKEKIDEKEIAETKQEEVMKNIVDGDGAATDSYYRICNNGDKTSATVEIQKAVDATHKIIMEMANPQVVSSEGTETSSSTASSRLDNEDVDEPILVPSPVVVSSDTIPEKECIDVDDEGANGVIDLTETKRSVHSSDDSSDTDDDYSDDASLPECPSLQINMAASPFPSPGFDSPLPDPPPVVNVVGPTGAVRDEVLSVLGRLQRRIRRLRSSTSVEFVRKARVPIIKYKTVYGVDVDVAVGGHNGTDTSKYVGSQAKKYASFCAVVVVLKVLLWQADLDAPFTGGLGSFRLYVLVAHHLRRHLAGGGSDRPGEILLSFFYRYGERRAPTTAPPPSREDDPGHWSRTSLGPGSCVAEDGGVADMDAVYKTPLMTNLFGACYERLRAAVNDIARRRCRGGKPLSLVGTLVRVAELKAERTMAARKAKLCRTYRLKMKKSKQDDTSSHRNGD